MRSSVSFRNTTASLAAYTFAHFCVDFACVFLLYRGFRLGVPPGEVAMGFLLYSVIAFGLQLPLGALQDSRPAIPMGLLGCGLTAAAFLFLRVPYAGLVLCAAGNALFHVGGGVDSLRHANGRMARSGIFVSTGAIGLALGPVCGAGSTTVLLPLALLLAGMGLILLTHVDTAGVFSYFHTENNPRVRNAYLALLLLFVAIMVRAYGGFLIPMPWRVQLLLLPGLAACLGKALGGILADRLGAARVGIWGLLASVPLILLCYRSPWLCALGILLFNINMPITLCAMSDRLPGSPGLAFGLTTFALLCGSIPRFFYNTFLSVSLAMFTGLALLSAGCIALTVRSTKDKIRRK